MPNIVGDTETLIRIEVKAITDKYLTAINHQICNK